MDRCLITGGSGFVGWWLYLHNKLHNSHNKLFIAAIDHAVYDTGDWEQQDWRYIIHLAPVPIDRVMVCAKRCKAKVLFASSGGVYDRMPNDYFKTKLNDENRLLYSGLDAKIARIFTTCGSHMKWDRYAIGNFIMQAEAGGPLQVQSRGLVVRSYMYGSDLAEWLWTILLDGTSGERYNVGSDEPHSTQELAFEVAKQFDPQPPINIIQQLQYEPRPFYVPDISRARDELGLSIKVSFEDAVRRTVEDYRREH